MINKELDAFGRYGIRSIEKENDKKLAKMGNNTSNDNKSEASKPADQQRRVSSGESKRHKPFEHENDTEPEKQSSSTEIHSQSTQSNSTVSTSSQNSSSSTTHKEQNGTHRPYHKKQNYSRNNWNSNYQNGSKGSTWPRQKAVHPTITDSAKGHLTKDQAERCKTLLEQPVRIVSKDNTKEFTVIPLELIFKLKNMLRSYGINPIKDGIRFVGSGTAYVLSDPTNGPSQEVNDLDFCIYINHDTRNGTRFLEILQIEETILADMIYDSLRENLTLREVYDLFFLDSVKVDTANPKECWSLVTIGQKGQKTIDIRVVYHSSRSWVFSADSFEIVMDKMFRRKPQKQTSAPVSLPPAPTTSEQPKEHKEFKEQLLIQPEEASNDQTQTTPDNQASSKTTSKPVVVNQWLNPPSIFPQKTRAASKSKPEGPASPRHEYAHSISNVPPPSEDDEDILVESLYGDYKEALDHLHKNLLCTKEPQDIRKGMLRYCYELAKGRVPKPEDREMLDKVFLDSFLKEKQTNFEDVLSKFLLKHSVSAEEFLKELRALIDKSSKEDMEGYVAVIDKLQHKYTTTAKGNA